MLTSIDERFGKRQSVEKAVFVVFEGEEQVRTAHLAHAVSYDARPLIVINTGIRRPMDRDVVE